MHRFHRLQSINRSVNYDTSKKAVVRKTLGVVGTACVGLPRITHDAPAPVVGASSSCCWSCGHFLQKFSKPARFQSASLPYGVDAACCNPVPSTQRVGRAIRQRCSVATGCFHVKATAIAWRFPWARGAVNPFRKNFRNSFPKLRGDVLAIRALISRCTRILRYCAGFTLCECCSCTPKVYGVIHRKTRPCNGVIGDIEMSITGG